MMERKRGCLVRRKAYREGGERIGLKAEKAVLLGEPLGKGESSE